MKKFLMSAAALAMMVPGVAMAATDGDVGATSTGSFSATMNVQPPAGVTVQVVGLIDFDFGTVTTTNTAGTSVSAMSTPFCLMRSDAGQVRVNVVQTALPAGQSYALQGTLDTNADGVTDNIPVSVTISNPSGGGAGLSNNVPTNFDQSGTNCPTAGNPALAHVLQLTPSTLPDANTLRLSGAYTAQFTMTVSVP